MRLNKCLYGYYDTTSHSHDFEVDDHDHDDDQDEDECADHTMRGISNFLLYNM